MSEESDKLSVLCSKAKRGGLSGHALDIIVSVLSDDEVLSERGMLHSINERLETLVSNAKWADQIID